MKRLAHILLATLVALSAVWLAGQLCLEVQLPARGDDFGIFPEPMPTDLPLYDAFERLPGPGGNPLVRLLDANVESWAERWRLLQRAEHTLDVSYFILKPDIFGMAFLGHLIQRSRDGVRIRVLLDAMGTSMSRDLVGNDYLDALVNAENIEVRMYRPLRFRYLDTFLTLNLAALVVSEHDKILLADGRSGIVGGRNISAEYFTHPADNPAAFRDVDVALDGMHIAPPLRAAFEVQYGGGEAHAVSRETINLASQTQSLLLAYRAMDSWLRDEPVARDVVEAIAALRLPWLEQLRALPRLKGALTGQRTPALSAPVRIVDSRTRLVSADDAITRSLIRLLRSARKEVFIQSPYLVLPEAAAKVLEETAGRGVRITIFTNGPESSDNAWSQAFFLEQWQRLLKRVPGLTLYVAGGRRNVHGKLAVVDGMVALVGTYNADPLSMTMNSELLVAIRSPTVAARLLEAPLRQIAAGAPEVYRYRLTLAGGGQSVASGAIGHVPAAVLRQLQPYRWAIRIVRNLPGQWPLL